MALARLSDHPLAKKAGRNRGDCYILSKSQGPERKSRLRDSEEPMKPVHRAQPFRLFHFLPILPVLGISLAGLLPPRHSAAKSCLQSIRTLAW